MKIAAGSAFAPGVAPFHVPLLGGLHRHSAAHVAQTIEAAAPTTAPLRGRFVRWDVRGGQLRALVDLDRSGFQELVGKLKLALHDGRPWDPTWVTLGSVADIDASSHSEFMEAVAAAFPIDAAMEFTLAGLEFYDAPQPRAKSAATTTKTNESAMSMSNSNNKKRPAKKSKGRKPATPARQAAHVPAADASRGAIRKPRQQSRPTKPPRNSPHRKWERVVTVEKAPTGSSISMDELIRRTGASRS